MALDAGPYTEAATSKYIEVDGVPIHYNEAGSGEPLICINAWGEGMTAWFTYHRNLEELAENYRVLLLDPIHTGRSGTAFAESTTPELHRALVCRYIKGFMDALGIEQAAMIGTSTGGTTALCFALLYPGSVSKIVLSGCGISNGDNALLFNPVFYDEETAEIVCRQEGIKLGLAAMMDPSRDNIERFAKEALVFNSNLITDEHVDHMCTLANEAGSADKRKHLDSFYASFLVHNNLPDLPKFKIPTLFFHGRYDNVVSPEVAVQAVGLIPDCRVVLLRCGNLLPFEKPDDFSSITLGFLAS